MLSPFEELEYLSDYLPEEGESVVVSRRSGELICEPYQTDSLRDGIADARLYGVLVQANERLNSLGTLPIWCTVIGFFWICTALGLLGLLDLNRWYLIPGLSLLMLPGCIGWIRLRQHRRFVREVLPMLDSMMRVRRIDPYAFLGAVRQHEEMRTLLDEMIRWIAPPGGASSRRHPELD